MATIPSQNQTKSGSRRNIALLVGVILASAVSLMVLFVAAVVWLLSFRMNLTPAFLSAEKQIVMDQLEKGHANEGWRIRKWGRVRKTYKVFANLDGIPDKHPSWFTSHKEAQEYLKEHQSTYKKNYTYEIRQIGTSIAIHYETFSTHSSPAYASHRSQHRYRIYIENGEIIGSGLVKRVE